MPTLMRGVRGHRRCHQQNAGCQTVISKHGTRTHTRTVVYYGRIVTGIYDRSTWYEFTSLGCRDTGSMLTVRELVRLSECPSRLRSTFSPSANFSYTHWIASFQTSLQAAVPTDTATVKLRYTLCSMLYYDCLPRSYRPGAPLYKHAGYSGGGGSVFREF